MSEEAKARWQRIEAALDELIDLAPEARAAAVERLAAGDAALRAELEALVAGLADGTTRLDQAASAAVVDRSSEPEAPPRLPEGTRLGPWRLTGWIGAGGMGEVYRAERADGQFEQTVAVKLVRADVSGAAERFQRERQIVARLDHPGIARLLDGGLAPDGRPYMVIELVQGLPLMAWCAGHRPSLGQRLALFVEICRAVAYAHRNLVVHRDIKPGNVLVTAEGDAKLLDFGVARLLESPTGEATRELLLTPAYASPEQMSGGPITTAADVYALGLLLHEMLVGRPAFDLRQLPLAAAMRAVATVPAPAPSRAAREQPLAPVAPARLAGDLDAIVAKALRKEPEARYASVDALVEDVERHRRHEPVQARRGHWAYVTGRAVRRHRGLVAGAALALLAVLGGSVATALQARQARADAALANAVQGFALSLFKGALPEQARGREITARELLARGRERLDTELASQPLALARMHSELGDIYEEIGDYVAAEAEADRAVQSFAALGRPDSRDGLEALFRRGVAHMDRSRWDEARADFEACQARALAAFGPTNRWAVATREKLAFIDLSFGHYEEAMRKVQEALALPPGEDPANDAMRRLRVRVVRGMVEINLGRFADARRTLQAAVADAEGPAGKDVTDRMVYRVMLAQSMHYGGDSAAAVAEMAKLVPEMDRVLGPLHQRTVDARQLWSQALAGVGDYAQAIEVARQNLAHVQERDAADGYAVAIERSILAQQFRRAYRFEEALPLASAALAQNERQFTEPNNDREFNRRMVGEVLLGLGRLKEGTAALETARAFGHRIEGFDHSPTGAGVALSLSVARRLAGDWGGARDLLAEACAQFRISPGPDTPAARRCEAERRWVDAMAAPADAAARDAFASAAEMYRRVLPPTHPARADLEAWQAELDARGGRLDARGLAQARARWHGATGVAPDQLPVFLR